MMLLNIMIRRGQASRVSSLFFLVTPVATLLGYLILDEALGPMELVGMGVAAVGVALVMAPQQAASTSGK